MDSTTSLRSLPPRARAVMLRLMLLAHFPHSPRAVAGLPDQPGMPGLDPQEGPKRRRQRGCVRVLVLSLLAMICIAAAAVATPAHAGTWRMDVNAASYHTEAWARRSLNQRNPGLGIAWQASRTWAIAGGVYYNSYRRPTWYALGAWTPVQIGADDGWHVDAGLAAGLVSGYRRNEVSLAPFAGGALVRIVAPNGVGVNLVGVPNQDAKHTGFIGLQLSFPLN
jgi:hypothetical protein